MKIHQTLDERIAELEHQGKTRYGTTLRQEKRYFILGFILMLFATVCAFCACGYLLVMVYRSLA